MRWGIVDCCNAHNVLQQLPHCGNIGATRYCSNTAAMQPQLQCCSNIEAMPIARYCCNIAAIGNIAAMPFGIAATPQYFPNEEDNALHYVHAMGMHNRPDGRANGRFAVWCNTWCVQTTIAQRSMRQEGARTSSAVSRRPHHAKMAMIMVCKLFELVHSLAFDARWRGDRCTTTQGRLGEGEFVDCW